MTGSSVQEVVAQVVPIVAIEPRFVLPSPVVLHLKEKIFSWSGDSFKINDPNTGIEYFQIKGKAFSFRSKKALLDNTGAVVCNLKENVFALQEKYTLYLGDSSDRSIGTVHCGIAWTTKLRLPIVNQTNGQEIVMYMRGDWLSKQAAVYLGKPEEGGVPVASVSRPLLTSRNILFDKQDYVVTIAPGVDIALIVMMCIVLDEHTGDKD